MAQSGKSLIIIEDDKKSLQQILKAVQLISSNFTTFLIFVTRSKNSRITLLSAQEETIPKNNKLICHNAKELKNTIDGIEGDKIIIADYLLEQILGSENEYRSSGMFDYYSDLTKNINDKNIIGLYSSKSFVTPLSSYFSKRKANESRFFIFERYKMYNHIKGCSLENLILVLEAFNHYYDKCVLRPDILDLLKRLHYDKEITYDYIDSYITHDAYLGQDILKDEFNHFLYKNNDLIFNIHLARLKANAI